MAEREILFRGKRTYNGKWVEGSLVVTSQGGAYIISTVEDKRDATVLVNQCSLNVDPETVGQYTGLTDKNDKKIFEGDIIQSTETKETAVVQWFPEHSAFMVWCKSSNEVGFLYECTKSIIEVIGNIHDNPEILKGGEDNG